MSSGDGTDGDYYYYLGQIWVGSVGGSFDQFCVCFFCYWLTLTGQYNVNESLLRVNVPSSSASFKSTSRRLFPPVPSKVRFHPSVIDHRVFITAVRLLQAIKQRSQAVAMIADRTV